MSEWVKANLESRDDNGEIVVRIQLEGKSDMPFWNHDIKLEAVKSLLGTIDRKEFYEVGMDEEFERYMSEIQEILEAVRS
jgi:hypothetical protein